MAALGILAKLEKDRAGSFTPYTWFRFYALRGHAHRLCGENEAAAHDFLRAKQARPDLERAQALEVLAHQQLGDDDTALRLAADAKQRLPQSGTIASLWLQSSPLTTSFDELERDIPSHLRSDAEVLMGLALAAIRRGDARGLDYARQAVTLNPEWIDAKIIWATSVLDAHIQNGSDAATGNGRGSIEAARTALAESIDKVRRSAKPDHLARLYLNLAAAHQILGDHHAADQAILSARRLAPTDEDVLLQDAQRLARERRLDDAIELLDRSLVSTSPRVKLLSSQYRAQRGTQGDHKAALEVLRSGLSTVPRNPPELLSSWVETIGKLLLATGDWEGAKEFLQTSDATRHLTSLSRSTLLGLAEYNSGNAQEAQRQADIALAEISDTSDTGEICEGARLFERLERYDHALNAYRRAVSPRSPISLIRHVLSLAIEVEDDDYVLAFGKKLRNAGVKDIGAIEAELFVLEQASPRRAVEYIKALMESEPEGLLSRYLRMRLTHIGIHLNNQELIEPDANKLPHIDEVDGRLAGAVVEAIRRSADPLKAVAFAYELVRRSPDVEECHRAMIASVGMMGGGEQPSIPTVERVGSDTAVLLREIPSGLESWYVLEDTQTPKTTLNEIATECGLAKAITGKAVGDEADFEEGFGSTRRVAVVKLLHKFIYRFRTCLEELPKRFPDQKFFKAFSIKEGVPPEEAFSEMLSFMGKINQRDDELAIAYRDNLVTLQIVAGAIGKPLAGAISLIASKGYPIKCVEGLPDMRAKALDGLRMVSSVVVEPTALATCFLLSDCFGIDFFESVATWSIQLLVVEQAIDDLERIQRDLASGYDRLGAVRSGGEWRPSITPGDRVAESARKLALLISAIRTHCTIVPNTGLNAIDLKLRADLVQICGRASVESIIAAKERGLLLWTDDAAIAALALTHEGVKRVWTQVLGVELASRLGLKPEWFMSITLSLLSLRYDFTWVDNQIAIFAASQAKWDPNVAPFKYVLDVLGNDSLLVDGIVGLTVALLREVWTSPMFGLQAINVTQRILDRVAKRPDGRGIIQSIYQAANEIFGLHVMAAANMRRAISTWWSANPNTNMLIRPR